MCLQRIEKLEVSWRIGVVVEVWGQLDVGEVAVDLFVCVCGSHIVPMNRASSWRLESSKNVVVGG